MQTSDVDSPRIYAVKGQHMLSEESDDGEGHDIEGHDIEGEAAVYAGPKFSINQKAQVRRKRNNDQHITSSNIIDNPGSQNTTTEDSKVRHSTRLANRQYDFSVFQFEDPIEHLQDEERKLLKNFSMENMAEYDKLTDEDQQRKKQKQISTPSPTHQVTANKTAIPLKPTAATSKTGLSTLLYKLGPSPDIPMGDATLASTPYSRSYAQLTPSTFPEMLIPKPEPRSPQQSYQSQSNSEPQEPPTHISHEAEYGAPYTDESNTPFEGVKTESSASSASRALPQASSLKFAPILPRPETHSSAGSNSYLLHERPKRKYTKRGTGKIALAKAAAKSTLPPATLAAPPSVLRVPPPVPPSPSSAFNSSSSSQSPSPKSDSKPPTLEVKMEILQMLQQCVTKRLITEGQFKAKQQEFLISIAF